MNWTPANKHPKKNDTRVRLLLADGTILEDVYYITNYFDLYNWITYSLDETGKRINSKPVDEREIGYPKYNYIVFWQADPLPEPIDFTPSEDDLKFMRVESARIRGDEILRSGVTHPAIDLDFYDWLKTLSAFDKEFLLERAKGYQEMIGIAMFAWQRSRTELKKKAEKPLD